MARKKSFTLSKGVLIGLAALAATLGLGLTMPIKPNISVGKSGQAISISNVSAQVPTQKRIEGLRTAMLSTWQQEAKIKGLSHTAPKRFQGETIKAANLIKKDKVIALTFDDGPWPTFTTQVLNILKQNNIKATFFVVGQNAKNYPDMLKRIVNDGHTIGNHTWHHWYHHMSPQAAAFEVDKTTNIINEITGVKTTLFRPPGGIMTNGVAAYARSQKYTLVMWSSDSVDYNRPPVARLISNVMSGVGSGGIVLLHDGGGDRVRTVQSLPQIISTLKKQGYRFVTVPELLEMKDRDLQIITAKKQ